MMQCDTWRVCDETSGVSPGLSRHRDGFRTKHGMSHNSIPPSRPHLEAWEGWSVPVPRRLVPRNKRRRGKKGRVRIVLCLARRNSQQP